MKAIQLFGHGYRKIRGNGFTKKKVLIVLGSIVFLGWFVPLLAKTGWHAATQNQYTATVLSSSKSDATPALIVMPAESIKLNTTKNNEYKLLVQDVRSFLFWETRSERFESLNKGDVVCLTQVGFRSGWMSAFPTAVRYTRGDCKPS